MQLKKVVINNFKGIDELEFEPKKINVITGKNNVGKTSLLEAIDLVSNPDKVSFHSRRYPQIINVHSQEAKITANVITRKKDKLITLELRRPDVQAVRLKFKERLLKEFKLLFNREFASDKKLEEDLKGILDNQLSEQVVFDLSKNSLLISANDVDNIYFSIDAAKPSKELYHFFMLISKRLERNYKVSARSDVDEDHQTKLFEESSMLFDPSLLLFRLTWQLGHYKLKTEGITFIEDLVEELPGIDELDAADALKLHDIEEQIKKFSLIKNLEKFDLNFLIFRDENNKLIPIAFDNMGDGFKAGVGLLWHLSSKHAIDNVFLLEEPEKHMHPGYLRQLVKIIIQFSQKFNIQFFMTSHSCDLIASFFDEELTKDEREYLEQEFSLLLLQKTDEGSTLPTVYDYASAESSLNKLFLDLRGLS